MIEVTNPSPAFYGVGGARISAQDGATLRLEPTGMVTVLCSVTEQGQGTDGIFAQIAASAVGVTMDKVQSHHRRHRRHALRRRHLGLARRGHRRRSGAAGRPGAALEHPRRRGGRSSRWTRPSSTSSRTRSSTGSRSKSKLALAELGRIAYFRPDTLPLKFQSELTVTRHYTPREYGFTFTNGIQASLRRGRSGDRLRQAAQALVRRGLRHGDQPDARGRADPRRRRAGHRRGALRAVPLRREGQLLNGNMADYLVPMAGEMPDIVCAHVETPTSSRSSARRARAKPAPPARRPR